MGEFAAACAGIGGLWDHRAGDGQTQHCALAGVGGQTADQGFLAVGKAGGAAWGAGGAVDQLGVFNLPRDQRAGPFEAGGQNCAILAKQGADLADALLDQPLSQE